MYNYRTLQTIAALGLCLATASCKVPAIVQSAEKHSVPATYTGTGSDTTNLAALPWRKFFTDPHLVALIDTALQHNQELNITLQEIEIAKSEVRLRKGQLLPAVAVRAGLGVEKVGRYTSQGAGDASTEIAPGKEMPDPLSDLLLSGSANWEVDIWKKLRTAKKAAVARFLATVEGKNFVLTNLISEVANSYYELLALDAQLDMVRQNIALQKNALEVVKVQKEASRVTELAVQKFQAEVLRSQGMEFDLLQQVTETENKINFLLGRYPQAIAREKTAFTLTLPPVVAAGIPSQLLANRPDVKQAELELTAAKLDVSVARAEFLPAFGISAALGFQAFNPSYLVKFPESMLYSLAGDLAAPLINRNALHAEFNAANARQLQALYNYERSILNGYLEVANGLSNLGNLQKSYDLNAQQVEALHRSIDISNDLFKSARADYLEVLMTQRDALDAQLDLIETRKKQWNAVTEVYRSLGGGWK